MYPPVTYNNNDKNMPYEGNEQTSLVIISLLRQEITDIHSQVAPVNLYEFAHHSIHDSSAKWLGVVHGANYPYDFRIPFQDRSFHTMLLLFLSR